MFIDKYEHYSQWYMGVCYDVLIAIKKLRLSEDCIKLQISLCNCTVVATLLLTIKWHVRVSSANMIKIMRQYTIYAWNRMVTKVCKTNSTWQKDWKSYWNANYMYLATKENSLLIKRSAVTWYMNVNKC